MINSVALGEVQQNSWVVASAALPSLLTVRAAGDMTRGGPPRRVLYESLGIDAASVCVVNQVHSRTVFVVDEEGGSTPTELGDDIIALEAAIQAIKDARK